MNMTLPASTLRSFAARPSRAALSPLARRRPFAAALPAAAAGGAAPVRWWNPHVIDRLRAPLTRWHD